MELTYENMMDHIEKYFAILPSIDSKADPGIVDKIKEFFTPDFKIHWADPPKVSNREQWVEYLCGHADIYRARVIYQPAPWYFMIDERKKMADGLVKEELLHPVTGEVIGMLLLNEHLEFTLVEGAVKVRYQIITHIPNKIFASR